MVLLKFVVNEQGEITTTGPQARVKSQPDGSFRILDVPRDLRAAYRIGTRVEGRLHQSNVVFLNDQDSSYQVEVQVPVLSKHTVTDPDIESISVSGHGYLQTSPEYLMKKFH